MVRLVSLHHCVRAAGDLPITPSQCCCQTNEVLPLTNELLPRSLYSGRAQHSGCGWLCANAKIAVYFAPNTSQGFVDAISQTVHDQTNSLSGLSISWGSAEAGWSGQAVATMHQAFADAALPSVTVFAAFGNGLATDGVADGHAQVDYPASDPFVGGCGGTHITAAGGKISSESVSNSNGGGTRGGVSSLFPKPAYHTKISTPRAPTSKGGRRTGCRG